MIENRITPACPYIFPSARRRSGMAARQVRRSVVIRNLQIRLLAMDSDRTPLGKGKDVLHGAARAAPLRQSVEQPWGGHAASSPAISANPLSLFRGSRRARDSAQPEEPSWNTGTSIAPPSRAHRAHSNCRARTARGGSSGGRGGPQAERGTAAGPGETPAHDPEEHLYRLLMIAKRMRRLHPPEYRSLPPQSRARYRGKRPRKSEDLPEMIPFARPKPSAR